jgi:CheY-like chemotaxis protein
LYRWKAEGTKMQTVGRSEALAARPARKVVVVNGNADVLDLLETALDGGRYDLLFADAGQHAYSLIKREQPDLVVLSVNIEATEGFQLLSMLKLDPGTEHIPVVTYTTNGNPEDRDEDEYEDDRPLQAPHAPMRLH